MRGVSERLGLSGGEAAELVARVPPVVAAEGRLLQLSIGGKRQGSGVHGSRPQGSGQGRLG